MVKKNWAKMKKKMQKVWDSRNEDPGNTVPDGIYTMQLQDCSCGETDNEVPYVEREHLIIEGEYSGEVVKDRMFVNEGWGVRFFKLWLEKMGEECPDDWADIEEVVDTIALKSPTYKSKKTTNDAGFVNVREQNVIDEGTAPDSEEEPAEEPSIELEEGMAVTFSLNDEQTEGEVVAIYLKEGFADVQVDGDVYEVQFDDITKSEESKPEEESSEDGLDEAFAFCQAHDIEVDDELSLSEVMERIDEWEWNASDLMEDEVKWLQEHDIKVKGVKKVTKKKKKKSKK